MSLGVGDLSVIPRLRRTLRPLVAKRSATIDRHHREVTADRHRVVRVPVSELSDPYFREAGPDIFVADLFHPSEASHALWAELFEPFIRSQLEAVSLARCGSR